MLDVDVELLGPRAIARLLLSQQPEPRRENRMADTLLQRLLAEAVERGASDLHLAPGYPPTFRIHGRLLTGSTAVLTPEASQALVHEMAPPRLRGALDELKNVDCSLTIGNGEAAHRFRANLYLSLGGWCAALRHLPAEIPAFEWLGFPQAVAERLLAHVNGLVIVTGATGSGKTSTIAALINAIRQDTTKRILTLEEPVEHLHPITGGGMITQREVGRDVDSFADGLRFGLRQDPDVIFVGEVRDRETAQMALSAAETGHLVVTTLHTRDAKSALTRLIDLFPQDQQDVVQSQLALSLRTVVAQLLLPAESPGEKRALALEVLHATSPVQVAIRTGRIETIDSAMQAGKKDGQITLDDDLQRLLAAGRISLDVARRFARDPSAFTAVRPAW